MAIDGCGWSSYIWSIWNPNARLLGDIDCRLHIAQCCLSSYGVIHCSFDRFVSVVVVARSGVTFPTMAMIGWVQPFTLLFPYTYFMKLYIDHAVRGGAWWLSMQELAAMLLFCLLPLLLLERLKTISIRRKFWGRV